MSSWCGLIFLAFHVFPTQSTLLRTYYPNTALADDKAHPPQLSMVAGATFNASSKSPFSGTLTGMLELRPGVHRFACEFEGTSVAFVWIDGHMVCSDGNVHDMPIGDTDNPLPIDSQHARTYPFRLHVYYNGSNASGTLISAKVRLNESGVVSDIPPEDLTPDLTPPEKRREDLQRGMSKGWGFWLHQNILSVVQLPSSTALSMMMCRKSTGQCFGSTYFEDQGNPVYTRPGLYANDRSYMQYYVSPHNSSLNISVEASDSSGDLDLVVRVVGDPEDNWELRVTGRFLWYRAGEIQTPNATAMVISPYNLPRSTVTFGSSSRASKMSTDDTLAFPLAAGAAITATTRAGQESQTAAVEERVYAARVEEENSYGKWGELAETKAAVQAAVMWNMAFLPMENGPILPVARSWNKVVNAVNSDWNYVLFDWDNFFASYLAHIDNRDLAYSNLIQIVKSKTAAGFVPNYSAGGCKSQDRTEPPIGAMVLEEIYNLYQEDWLVALLADDLIDWQDWFFRRRTLDCGTGELIALGSYNLERELNHGQGDLSDNMQAARFESGLDNSPMYDGEFYSNVTHQMQACDVGMSALTAADGLALARLLSALNRSTDAERIKTRAEALGQRVVEGLWDEQTGAFVNRFANGTFNRRITPTSFYPLMTGMASDKQLASMVDNWLFNASRFCIAPKGDYEGNSDECYWGLPSISADDPAFPALGYWRGYVWGPMAMLTYWSLRNAGLGGDSGREALAKQLQGLMLSQWRMNGHICENFSPHKNATECTGDWFYHWGALTGFMSVLEAAIN